MVDVEQGQRRPSTPFLRLLGPPPTPKTPPSDSRDPQTSPFERPQTPPARREPLNQAILTSLQRSRTHIVACAEHGAEARGYETGTDAGTGGHSRASPTSGVAVRRISAERPDCAFKNISTTYGQTLLPRWART